MPIDTVNDLPPRVQYSAAASQTVFPYPFPIFEDGDLVVDVDGATKALNTDYTVSDEGEDTGGNVTFLVARTAGQVVTIYRDLAIERTSDFQTNGPLSSDTFNNELDRITLVQQQLKDAINRSLRLPVTTAATSSDTEISAAAWASKYMAFDSDGVPEPATAITSTTLTQSVITALTNFRSAAEIAAGVTPTNYNIASNDVLGFVEPARYGFSQSATGATNYTAMVNAHAVAVAAGCAILTPSGTFPYTPLAAINLAVNWVGFGMTTLTVNMSAYSGIVFQQIGSTTISNIYLQRTGTMQGTAIRQAPVTTTDFTGYQHLNRVWCIGFGRNLQIDNVFFNSYRDCRFNDGTTGIYFVPSENCNEIVFTNCEVRGNVQNHLFTSTLQSRGITFVNCGFEAPTTTASTFTRCRELSFIGCYAEDSSSIKALVLNDCSASIDGLYMLNTAGITLGTNTEIRMKGVRVADVTSVLTGGDSTQVVSMEDCQFPSSGNSLSFLRFHAITSSVNGTWYGTTSSSFTGTGTGFTGTAPTGNVTYTYDSNSDDVTALVPVITGTSNSTAFTLTGMPAAIWPATTQYLPAVVITDNGASTTGVVQISSAGVITFFVGANASGFTGSGTKGVGVVLNLRWKKSA